VEEHDVNNSDESENLQQVQIEVCGRDVNGALRKLNIGGVGMASTLGN